MRIFITSFSIHTHIKTHYVNKIKFICIIIQSYNQTVDNHKKQSYTLFIFSTIRCRIVISRFNITKEATQGGDSIVTRLHLDEIRHTDIQFLCADLMDAAIKFYQSPTHQAEFEQWCRAQKGDENNE